MTAQPDFLPDSLRGRVKGDLEAEFLLSPVLAWNPPLHTCTGARKTDESLWAGGDRTPRKNFLQPPGERCCEEAGLLGAASGLGSSLFSSWSNPERVVLAAEGRAAPKARGLRSQWDDFKVTSEGLVENPGSGRSPGRSPGPSLHA